MRTWMMVVVLYFCVNVILCAEGNDFQTQSAKKAKQEYDISILQAQKAFNKAKMKANQKYRSALKRSLSKAMKAENLTEAVKITSQISVLTEESVVVKQTSRSEILKNFVGVWNFQREGKLIIKKDFTCSTSVRPNTGTWKITNKGIVVSWKDGATFSISLNANWNRLSVQYKCQGRSSFTSYIDRVKREKKK